MDQAALIPRLLPHEKGPVNMPHLPFSSIQTDTVVQGMTQISKICAR